MQKIILTIEPHAHGPMQMLVPTGFNDGFSTCTEIDWQNLTKVETLSSDFAAQNALVMQPIKPGEVMQLCFRFEPKEAALPQGFWQQQRNRFTLASQALAGEVNDCIDKNANQKQQIRQLIELAKQRFDYGHVDERFNHGLPEVPVVCGTTKGSCVDINTYLLACAKELGIDCQYVAGYWFHPKKTHTLDMHCWLLFRVGEQIIPWDLAHHLKWGLDELREGLNPAGGRRVAMSFGRGLQFLTANGPVSISHFSEPVWLLPNGEYDKVKLRIDIEESTQALSHVG